MSEIKLNRNFAILIWISGFIMDLKDKSLRLRDLPSYLCSLFRVVFCRMKYPTINTKWATEWYKIKGGSNYNHVLYLSDPNEDKELKPFLKYSDLTP